METPFEERCEFVLRAVVSAAQRLCKNRDEWYAAPRSKRRAFLLTSHRVDIDLFCSKEEVGRFLERLEGFSPPGLGAKTIYYDSKTRGMGKDIILELDVRLDKRRGS